jgi:beta-glucosidase
MRRHLSKALALVALTCVGVQTAAAQAPATPLPQLGRAPLRAVVAALSDSEKVRLVVGVGLILPEGMPTNMLPPGMLGSPRTADDRPLRIPGSAGETHAVRRLGIPSITLSDGPAGVRIDPIRMGANGKPDSARTFYATAFPVGTLLASSWDTSLVRRVGVAFGEEAKDFGVDILLMPGMNLHRNPLGGRNFEYYSEDPLVTGLLAAAMVNGVQLAGVGTSVKHFVANEQEFNRMRMNSAISERAFRELYLRPFQTVVRRAQPWTVMSSYNLVNGKHTAESRELLTDILRGEWAFGGTVMSDWFGGEDPVAMLNAGNDLLMPGTAAQEVALRAALANGTLSRAALDASVTRLLELVLRSNTMRATIPSERPDLRAHAAVARQAAAESMVLLRNEARASSAGAALPLPKGSTIAAFGNTSYDPIAGGTGSGNVNRAYTISVAQGLDSAQLLVDSAVSGTYARYLDVERAKLPRANPMNMFAQAPVIPEMTPDGALVALAAERASVAVITLGRIAGEGGDRKVTDDFALRAAERELIAQVSRAFHARGKSVIVILNVGGPIELASWRGDVDAILLAYQPGQEGGHAIADILRGAVNPSGKLATSVPMSYDDIPYGADFPGRANSAAPPTNPMIGVASSNTYSEGVFVGYRYARSFSKEPAYAFGYGLSYTTFELSALKLAGVLNRPTSSLTVTATVTNTGRVAGREVVQLYISAPRGTLDKPERELRAFAKTGMLAPGGSASVTFTITASDLASFDTSASAWVADAGRYTLRVANVSSAEGVSAIVTLPRRVITERVRHKLVPAAAVAELRRPER